MTALVRCLATYLSSLSSMAASLGSANERSRDSRRPLSFLEVACTAHCVYLRQATSSGQLFKVVCTMRRSDLGAEVRIDGLSTDAIVAGEGSFRNAGRGLVAQLGSSRGVQRWCSAAVRAALLCQIDAFALTFADQDLSNSAKAPITFSRSVAIALSSPVKVSCSLTNSTRTFFRSEERRVGKECPV